MLKKTSSQLATQSNLFPTMFPRSSFPSKVHPPQQPIFYDMERPVLYLEQAELTLLGLENCPTGMLIAELVLPIYEEVQVRVDENPLGYLAEHTRPKNVKLEVEIFLPEFCAYRGRDGYVDESGSPLLKLPMATIRLTPEQQTFYGLGLYPPQSMISMLILPFYKDVKFQAINYFGPQKKKHLAVKVFLPGVPFVGSAHGNKDASSQTESTWSQAKTNWPPTNLPLPIPDEEINENLEIWKRIEMLLLLKSTQTLTPQLLWNNGTIPFVQPVARFGNGATSRSFKIPCGLNIGNKVLSMALSATFRQSFMKHSLLASFRKEYQVVFCLPSLLILALSIKEQLGAGPGASLAPNVTWTQCEIMNKLYREIRKRFAGLKLRKTILILKRHPKQRWFCHRLVISDQTRKVYDKK